MTIKSNELLLTFDAVWEYLIWNRRYAGPRPLLDDYRFAAGLLFERNDGTVRRLYTLLRQQPYIRVEFIRDFSSHQLPPLFVTDLVADQLREERIVEGSSNHTYGEKQRWRLSQSGAERVVTDWFKNNAALEDLFRAGMSYNVRTYKATWPTRS